MDNNELKHVGVLGMRWGVRRSRSQATTSVRGKRVPATTTVRGKKVAKTSTRTRLKLSMSKTEQKRVKRILDRGGGIKKVMMRDAGKAALAGGLISYGLTRMIGGSHQTAMASAAFSATLNAVGSFAINGFAYKQYKDFGGT